MTAIFTRAPTLAWLLVALTCFLAGMTVVEGRHQTVTLPIMPPVGVVVTVEVAYLPTTTPEPTSPPPPVATRTPTRDPLVPTPTPRSGGTGNVR